MTDFATPPAAFSLMSYNIFLGGAGRMGAITGIVREVAPDILGIQEADDETAVAKLAEDTGMDYVYGKANTIHHVAFLSRFPIKRSHNHPYPGIMRKTMLEAHVLLPDDRELMLFVAHLNATATINGERRRVREMEAILSSIGTRSEDPHLLFGDCNAIAPGDTLVFKRLTAHYTNRIINAEMGNRRRERQATFGAWLDRSTQNGLITSETFLPRHLVRRVLEAGYTDCFRQLHPYDPGYTFPAPDPAVRIDYVFAPPTMRQRLISCEVIDVPATSIASDHRPLVARFAL
jgi:endonuclease/exonuclease/phosphatase family metal-dependent hydrolase